MIIVTGGAGFIGSNLVLALNAQGYDEILVVDNLSNGQKFRNLVDCKIVDYLDKKVFLEKILHGDFHGEPITAIFHQGACSTTTEWDGRYMMNNNYDYSKALFHYCQRQEIPLILASSAAVYGGESVFKEDLAYESPLNIYGYSKFLFDQYLRQQLPKIHSQVAALRYFNVYGPREAHKESMASVAFHLNNQLKDGDKIRLFEGCGGFQNGMQKRDFVYVSDVVDVNLWFLEHPEVSGIFNTGTGKSQTFNDVANAVIAHHQRGQIEYIPFPDHLRGAYQSFTEANLDALRAAGCQHQFKTVEAGVSLYMQWLNQ